MILIHGWLKNASNHGVFETTPAREGERETEMESILYGSYEVHTSYTL